MKKIVFSTLLLLSNCGIASAIPNLQIYCPEVGVYYDSVAESWIIPYVNYELWIVGAGLAIEDVKIAFAVPSDENGSITIRNSQGSQVVLNEGLLSGISNYSDDYNKEDSFFIDSGTPLMGDGNPVPGGGIFPSSFYQYYLGDFGLTETVQNYTPGDGFGDTALGEIMKLDIAVAGYSMASMIAYDHVILGKNKAKYVKTPYSHDGGSNSAPEPATMLLFGTGIVGLIGARIRRRK